LKSFTDILQKHAKYQKITANLTKKLKIAEKCPPMDVNPY